MYGRKESEIEKINLPFLGSSRDWYRYQTGVVSVPLMQRQNGTGTDAVSMQYHFFRHA